jgi:hypothetical protein
MQPAFYSNPLLDGVSEGQFKQVLDFGKTALFCRYYSMLILFEELPALKRKYGIPNTVSLSSFHRCLSRSWHHTQDHNGRCWKEAPYSVRNIP